LVILYNNVEKWFTVRSDDHRFIIKDDVDQDVIWITGFPFIARFAERRKDYF